MSSTAREPSPRPILADGRPMRQRARRRTRQAAVPGGEADREHVIELLNTALASELISAVRYERQHVLAAGIHSRTVAASFLKHARDERGTPTGSASVSGSSAAPRT